MIGGIVRHASDGLLDSYHLRALRPAGAPSPCPAASVPNWLAAAGMVSAAALAYLAGVARTDRLTDDAYQRGYVAGFERTPPRRFL